MANAVLVGVNPVYGLYASMAYERLVIVDAMKRGGAPGTRETDLLNPLNMVERVNAVVLTGGRVIDGTGRPPIEQATAGQWNAAAQSNNRIEISIVER